MTVRVTFQLGRDTFAATIAHGIDLSTAIDFHTPLMQAFGLPAPSTAPFTHGDFIADTRHGAAVNCAQLALTPHGDGTHTECVGHITHRALPLLAHLPEAIVSGLMITVVPEALGETDERGPSTASGTDRVITSRAIVAAISPIRLDALPAALILRTRLDDTVAQPTTWTGTNPPYLTRDAAEYLFARGIMHLLLDLPSVDRESDGGELVAHRAFWGVDDPSNDNLDAAFGRTITEMIVVQPDTPDGVYALAMNVPALLTDAAPSRPVIYPAHRVSR